MQYDASQREFGAEWALKSIMGQVYSGEHGVFSLWSETDHRGRRTDVAFRLYSCIWGQETT